MVQIQYSYFVGEVTLSPSLSDDNSILKGVLGRVMSKLWTKMRHPPSLTQYRYNDSLVASSHRPITSHAHPTEEAYTSECDLIQYNMFSFSEPQIIFLHLKYRKGKYNTM
jgi:hypothetical protein